MSNKQNLDKEDVKLLPVNNELYDELFIQQLEQRLETDPLAANGLLSFFDNGMAGEDVSVLCSKINVCIWFCSEKR